MKNNKTCRYETFLRIEWSGLRDNVQRILQKLPDLIFIL